jgi:hypothetical protein
MVRKRELIDTGTDKRYMRRNKLGTSFVESDDVGRSLAADRRKRAKTISKPGEGDKGDRPRPKTKAQSRQQGPEESSQSERRRSEVCQQKRGEAPLAVVQGSQASPILRLSCSRLSDTADTGALSKAANGLHHFLIKRQLFWPQRSWPGKEGRRSLRRSRSSANGWR